jgi:hypothetical protein
MTDERGQEAKLRCGEVHLHAIPRDGSGREVDAKAVRLEHRLTGPRAHGAMAERDTDSGHQFVDAEGLVR